MSEARGGSQFTSVYRNAINSIKKYPLPIICRLQLESIHGIGDSLCEDFQKLIKQHYSYYLDSNFEDKFPKQSQHSRIISQTSKKSLNFTQNSENKRLNSQRDKSDSKSAKSMNINYKPRTNTANGYFLQVLRTHSKSNSSQWIVKEVVKHYIQLKYNVSKGKTWKLMESTLHQNGYILIQKGQHSQENQQIKYKLTEKGEAYINNIQAKHKQSQYKNKIIDEVNTFKSLNIQNQNLKTQEIQIQNDIQELSKILVLKNDFDVTKFELVIDNRQKNDKNQSNFFIEKLTQKYKINCRTSNLTLGDFVWIYDNQILDYIIERKKADDLASSIIDGRYKDQKYRLKNCGVSNVFYLYEGYPSDSCNVAQKQLSNALLKTRIKQKFKVYKAKDINQTMRFLFEIHQQIQQKIIEGKAKYLCPLQQFNELNSVHRNLSIEKMFALGLTAIPGVGKNTILRILTYFKTYRCLHDYLKVKFNNNEDKITFLKELFKGTGMNTSLPKIIVGLLFQQNYQTKEIQNQETSFQQSNRVLVEPKRTEFNKEKRFSIIRQESQSYEEQYNF